MALLKVVSHQNCLSITNNFYQSLIKKRIVMLNKKQSHKSNSWKYSLVLPFLIGFIFLFQIETQAQIKQQSTDSMSTSVESSSSTVSSIVTKTTTDSNLRELEKIFTTKTEKLIISKVKRNNRGEITSIKLIFDTGKTYVTVMERKAKEGITDIKIYVNTDSNNKKEVGFEDVSEVKAVPVEVFDEFGISTIDNVDEKQTYWSMDNMKKDGKDVVLIINGKVKDATEKIKLPMSQKLGEMKALTAAEFEYKYNQKADKNKLYYEVETVKIKTVKGSWDEGAKTNKAVFDKENKSENVIISETATNNQEKKIVIFQNDNGDDIVFIPSEKSLKIPNYPSVKITETSPILIVNGLEIKNPSATLNQMDLQKVKSIRVYDENNNETKGIQIKKVIIITK